MRALSFQCAYDADAKRCFEARPDLSTGGEAHSAFLHAVWALIAIRVVYELCCAGAIVVACALHSNSNSNTNSHSSSHSPAAIVRRCRVWIKGSALVPLLLARSATRVALFDELGTRSFGGNN